ncbi:MAG TPA: cysteine--tRNA ligase [Blastocatellia bacterium]|nr:cysteine--tRNA ligase [Blastocatellia bacterium]
MTDSSPLTVMSRVIDRAEESSVCFRLRQRSRARTMLRVRNTLSGQIEEFAPLEGDRVGLYCCGLTVYDYGHIGNFRTFVSIDILRRYLKYKGYRLLHVMNFTDVDDKTIRRAREEGISLRELTDRYIAAFQEDMRTLNLEVPEVTPRATDHIPEMVDLVKRLTARGYTYTSDGSIYFRISAFPEYGKLSKIKLDAIRPGARVDVDEYEKADVRDFVLWKAPKDDYEPRWETEIGVGRPGWHLECSAMSMKYLGETFDIHCGGVDLIFPHHENEIAQSEGATGKPFVRYWLHSEFLLVEGEKMSKSKGNFYTLRDLVARGYDPMAIRYALLSVPYRKQLNFTFDGLRAAETTLVSLRDFRARLREARCESGSNPAMAEAIRRAAVEFEEGMDNDLNTAQALAALHTLVGEANVALVQGQLRHDDRQRILEWLARIDTVLGVLGPEETVLLDEDVRALIEERARARAERNFARADEIRRLLAERGIILEDTKEGTRWRRK